MVKLGEQLIEVGGDANRAVRSLLHHRALHTLPHVSYGETHSGPGGGARSTAKRTMIRSKSASSGPMSSLAVIAPSFWQSSTNNP
jgi:hypothetical protein